MQLNTELVLLLSATIVGNPCELCVTFNYGRTLNHECFKNMGELSINGDFELLVTLNHE